MWYSKRRQKMTKLRLKHVGLKLVLIYLIFCVASHLQRAIDEFWISDRVNWGSYSSLLQFTVHCYTQVCFCHSLHCCCLVAAETADIHTCARAHTHTTHHTPLSLVISVTVFRCWFQTPLLVGCWIVLMPQLEKLSTNWSAISRLSTVTTITYNHICSSLYEYSPGTYCIENTTSNSTSIAATRRKRRSSASSLLATAHQRSFAPEVVKYQLLHHQWVESIRAWFWNRQFHRIYSTVL